jgi:potassium-transporting ATPase KdpC subunit
MKQIKTAVIVLLFWTVVTGGLYPMLVTGIGALCFPAKAAGSLVRRDGAVIGSELIGQDFQGDRYFHPRPSATGYNPLPSGGSNQGWTSAQLQKDAAQRAADWKKANATNEIPMEMSSASGSGLDPHISPRAAELQAPRVAAARHLSGADAGRLLALVRSCVEAPQLGFLGEARVNVLRLNLALDAAFGG